MRKIYMWLSISMGLISILTHILTHQKFDVCYYILACGFFLLLEALQMEIAGHDMTKWKFKHGIKE